MFSRFMEWAKDGGKDSPVDAFFLFEIKGLCSVALLKFNPGRREAYHSHAFNAVTLFLGGLLMEEFPDGSSKIYQRGFKYTPRNLVHRVLSVNTSYAITFRGPWQKEWSEHKNGVETRLTNGRKVVSKTKSQNR